MRLVRITGVDLNLFDFDYDLTWAAFFMNSEGKIYGRYGGRDAGSSESRISLAGLRYALQQALKTHQHNPQAKPESLPAKPVLAENYPAAKQLNRRECIHCHQVYEFRRRQLKTAGEWRAEMRWKYPLPENVGITLDVNQGDLVTKIVEASPAQKAGLQSGDRIVSVNGVSVASISDVQYGLHQAPMRGGIRLQWQRGEKLHQATLDLPKGWRWTNTTWRPSLLEILPALPLFGEDLTAEEKRKLKLPVKRLAFRQDNILDPHAQKVGVRAGDVVIGIDGLRLEMGLIGFLGYVRQGPVALASFIMLLF